MCTYVNFVLSLLCSICAFYRASSNIHLHRERYRWRATWTWQERRVSWRWSARSKRIPLKRRRLAYGEYGTTRVAQQNAIHIPRPLFPLFHLPPTENRLPAIVPSSSFPGPQSVFCWRQQRKRMPVLLHAIWVCCYSQRTGARYRTVIQLSGPSPFFCWRQQRKRMSVLRSMPFGFAATLREQTARYRTVI
jgi:hypothetical protein